MTDTKILDEIENRGIQIIFDHGVWYDEDGMSIDLPWRAYYQGTMGPPCETVREAVISLLRAKEDKG